MSGSELCGILLLLMLNLQTNKKKKKTPSGFEGISSRIMRCHTPVICDLLLNQCLAKNCFPLAFKTAKVYLLKCKSGLTDNSNFHNYIHISVFQLNPLKTYT